MINVPVIRNKKTFRNTLLKQSVPKRWHIKYRRRGITHMKAYNIQNTAKVGNLDLFSFLFRFSLINFLECASDLLSILPSKPLRGLPRSI